MKYSYPRKSYKKVKKVKKVRTTPKKESNVVKLQKQLNALTLKMKTEQEIKEIDFGILENSVSQVSGQGVGSPPINGIGISQLTNNSSVGGLTIAQGSAQSQRIGNFVNLRKMKWRVQIQNQIACPTPMRLRLEIWQLLGDPNTLISPAALLKYAYLPNQFYAQATSGSPTGPVSIWDTASQRNTQFKMSNIAKKIFTKTMVVPQEQFGTAIEIREHNFNVDLKNMKTGFNSLDQLQCQYYYFIFANTGNSSTSLLVDPNYTPGLGSYGINTGTRFNASVRLEYVDN